MMRDSQNQLMKYLCILILYVLVDLDVLSATTYLRTREDLESSGTNNNTQQQQQHICRVTVMDMDGPGDEDEMLVCDIVNEHGVSDYILRVSFRDEDIEAHKSVLTNHTWFIQFSKDQVIKGRNGIGYLLFNNTDEELNTVPYGEVERVMGITNRRLELGKPRHLTVLGQQTLTVVLIDVDMDEDYVYEHVFGKTDSLASQLEGCSHSQFTIAPHPTRPIITVSPRKSPDQYDFVELYQEVVTHIRYKMGVPTWLHGLQSASDFYLLVVPDNIDRHPNEVAWAPVNGFYFGVVKSWLDSVQPVMHEMGHNFGNSHAFEDGREYADTTTVMGFSRRVSKLCFNGQNLWHMEWYVDRRQEITFVEEKPQVVQIAFYGDYDKTQRNQPILVKVGDNMFLTFNRKKGMNDDTGEYADMLLIVEQQMGTYFPYSNLVGAVAANGGSFKRENYIGENIDLVIDVCEFQEGDDKNPDFLIVTISTAEDACLNYADAIAISTTTMSPTTSSPTDTPTNIPTSTPTTTSPPTTNAPTKPATNRPTSASATEIASSVSTVESTFPPVDRTINMLLQKTKAPGKPTLPPKEYVFTKEEPIHSPTTIQKQAPTAVVPMKPPADIPVKDPVVLETAEPTVYIQRMVPIKARAVLRPSTVPRMVDPPNQAAAAAIHPRAGG